MNAKESLVIQPKGKVTIEIVKDGKVVDRIEKKNLVVNGARTVICQLLAGANQAANTVTKIAIGTDNTAPALTDTALVAEVARVPIINYTFPDFNIVEFEAYVDQNTANGSTIQEIGLFTEGDVNNPQGTLVARTVVSPITKDSTFAFYIRWQIQLA